MTASSTWGQGCRRERPWLSPAYKGAHDSRHLTKAEPSAVDALFGAGRGTIHMVTIAPEVEGAMEAIRQVVDVIADGVHLHPQVARFAMLHAAGGFSLVTDAMAAAGGADGLYRLGGREVRVSGGRATLAGTDTIAGSTVTMHQAFQNVVTAGLSLAEAVQAASATPASRLGLSDVGRLEAQVSPARIALGAVA